MTGVKPPQISFEMTATGQGAYPAWARRECYLEMSDVLQRNGKRRRRQISQKKRREVAPDGVL